MTTLPPGALGALAATAALDPADPRRFPPRQVQIPRTGLRNGIGYSALALGGIGVAGAGASLVRALTSGGAMRVSLPMMLGFGAAALVGGGAFGLTRLIGPRTEPALAAGIPTRELALQVEARTPGRTTTVECADGTFAVLRDTSPTYSGGGGSSGRSRSRGSHSGGSRSGGWSPPSAPSSPSRPSSPSYPSSSGRSTSRGDDSGSSRNSTSNGNPSTSDF